MKELLRWALLAVSLLVVGPIAGRLVGHVRAPDGGPDSTMFISEAPALSTLLTLAAMALAGATGMGVARLVGVRTGYFAAGLVLIWPAFTSGTVRGVLLSARSGGPLWAMAGEGLLLGAVGVGLAWLIGRAGPQGDPERETEPAMNGASGVAFAAAVIVGAVAAWIIAREGLKGQTVAAAGIAGIAGATVGRVLAHRSPGVSFFAGMAALAAIGPVAAALMDGDAVAKSNANALFALAWMAPLDWVAGAFLGVPLGMTWGGSMLEKRSEVGLNPAAAGAERPTM